MDAFSVVTDRVESVLLKSPARRVLGANAAGAGRGGRAPVAARDDWKESIPPSEEAYFRTVAAEVEELQKSTAARELRPIDRGFHTKRHAILRGELTVADGLPPELRQGVFHKPGKYQTWVRFSNGDPAHRADRQPDIRGMGVKILDVPGEPLTPGQSSLDLLTILQATQPARNIQQFMGFVRAAQNPRLMPFLLAREVGVLEAARMLYWMATKVSRPLINPLVRDFHTAVPLRWGAYAAKCSFRAVTSVTPSGVNRSDPDFISRVIVDQLDKGPVRWELMVQLYTDPDKTPIEDSSVEWRAADAPYTKVADLRVGPENARLVEDEGEQARLNRMLAFSPWHAPVEHRPLGSIMRARRAAYESSARLRRADPRS